jgi:tetratricopeptide (TPR) repeat protein
VVIPPGANAAKIVGRLWWRLCTVFFDVVTVDDERKLKDRAHVLVRQGRVAAAIELYLKLIEVNRTDPSLRLWHAELCTRLKRIDAAVASYRIAAHLLKQLGHFAKAHAALKFAVRLAPTDMALRRALLELNSEEAQPATMAALPKDQPATELVSGAGPFVGDESEIATETFVPKWARA